MSRLRDLACWNSCRTKCVFRKSTWIDTLAYLKVAEQCEQLLEDAAKHFLDEYVQLR
jgi:hypothetical protein